MPLLNALRQLFRTTYATFTLSGFDDQERNLTFVKTAFQVFKLQFLACSMKQAFYPLYKQNIVRALKQDATPLIEKFNINHLIP